MSDIIKRKSKRGWRYYARGLLDVDETGKLFRTMRLVPFQTMDEAWEELRRLEREAEQRAYRILHGIPEPKPAALPAKPLTVDELCDKFLLEYSRPRIKNIKKYRVDARSTFKLYVRPMLGTQIATTVTRRDVERIRDDVQARQSKQTTVHVLKALGLLFKWAGAEDLIRCANPVTGVERPSLAHTSVPDFYSAEEITRLLGAAEKKAAYLVPAIALGAYAGLRAGEVCGLRWTDVDLDGGRIVVARSHGDTTKTEKVKHVPANAKLVRILREWKAQCPPHKRNVVIAIPKKRGKNGRIAKGRDLRLDDLLVEAKCHAPKYHPFHTLRHSFASLLAMGGTHPLELKELGRWSSLTMVERYAHLSPSRLSAQVARLDFDPKPEATISSIEEARQKRLDTEADTEVGTSPAAKGGLA